MVRSRLFWGDEAFAFQQRSGSKQSFSGRETNRLFVRHGGRFHLSPYTAGLASRLDGRSAVAADLDGDGDLDLVLRNLQERPVQVFENRLEGGRDRAVRVALRGPPGNPRGIGARVYATCGGRRQVRGLAAGSSFLAQGPAEATFGLGSCDGPVALEVVWPDGTAQAVGAVSPGERVVVTKGASLLRRAALGAPRPRAARDAAAPARRSAPLGDFRFATLAGPERGLLAEGDPRQLLVAVWSPFCSACRQEIPRLVRFAERHGDTYRVLYLTYEAGDPTGVPAAAAELGITRDVILGRADFFERTLPGAGATLPLGLLLDARGRPLARSIGGLDGLGLPLD